jgi:hypothetical protein
MNADGMRLMEQSGLSLAIFVGRLEMAILTGGVGDGGVKVF